MLKRSTSTEGEILQVSVLPYRCSICPPLVTRQMSNLAILANSETQNDFLFPVHAMFRHDCSLAVRPASTPWCLVHKKNLERFSTYWYAPFCCVYLGCCAAEFGSSGGTYELPCISTCCRGLWKYKLTLSWYFPFLYPTSDSIPWMCKNLTCWIYIYAIHMVCYVYMKIKCDY